MKWKSMERYEKMQWLLRLLNILFIVAISLQSGWMMYLFFAGTLVSVALQFRNDYKTYRRIDLITIIYSCLSLALAFLLAYSIIAPLSTR